MNGGKSVRFAPAESSGKLSSPSRVVDSESKTAPIPIGLGISPEQADFRTEVLFTPKVDRSMQYVKPQERVDTAVAPPSSLTRPNHEDLLRRVSVVIYQHIKKCEARKANAKPEDLETGKFHISKMNEFDESNFASPQYVCHFTRILFCRTGFQYGVSRKQQTYHVPDPKIIHEFLSTLFDKAQLSAECSIVCLIYIERLMERANVPLVSSTWKPLVLCGLLIASKVWQDIGSWNVEFSECYPEFPLSSINNLERIFCGHMQWDLYISSSLYAKYYFALRSLTAKQDFRKKYNVMMTKAPMAEAVSQRTEAVKEEFLAPTLSRSL